VQMCHVEVRDRYRVWHGACHLDDALQAPPSHVHFDGYRQGPETETPYAPYEHIPGLNRGGWHDAGDYDLAAGSQAMTTFVLALIRETFGVDTDQTTVRPDERLVLLHTPDGVPDIIQQVAHGVEALLPGYRVAGHSFAGIIEGSLRQYVHLGDASTMTDNRIYDPTLRPGQVVGERSGTMDDRWVFTSRDTGLEYQVATALAAASRVLRGYQDALAEECLRTAVGVWEYEQAREPVEQRSAYVPGSPDVQEVMAAVELLLTTGEVRYRRRLLELWPVIQKNIARVGWSVTRALPLIEDVAFAHNLRAALQEFKAALDADLSTNPFGVPFHPHIWGAAWNIQWHALAQYYLNRAFPDLFGRENVLRALNYVLGCHPASDVSLVSGVGARSVTCAYGANRADWSYIPGGGVSGPNLIRPDFPELKQPFPFLWQQVEYVISGAATYIFCVLAADRLLNG
jgi:Glycosyl hydrolase family 9.